jgi:hypothetical protein
MAGIRYDPENPPEQPPGECVDPLLWRVAHALHQEHQLELDDRCTCGEIFPCARAGLAARGLLIACTRSPTNSAPPNASHYPRGWLRRSI